jgi:hypothetical protein
MKITETKEGATLEVFAKPKSRVFKVVIEADEIVVFCREEPIEGRANKEMMTELSKLFHRKVELVSGFSSRQKRFFVRGADKGEVEKVLLHKQG